MRTLLRQARSAASEIASALSVAYAVRRVADYEPEIAVVFESSGFRLSDHTDAEARRWKERIEREKGSLIRVSRELGIV